MYGRLTDPLGSIDDIVKDPVGEVVNMAVEPIYNTVDLIDGLTEGQLRQKAAINLGSDIAMGLAASELVEWYQSLKDDAQ